MCCVLIACGCALHWWALVMAISRTKARTPSAHSHASPARFTVPTEGLKLSNGLCPLHCSPCCPPRPCFSHHILVQNVTDERFESSAIVCAIDQVQLCLHHGAVGLETLLPGCVLGHRIGIELWQVPAWVTSQPACGCCCLQEDLQLLRSPACSSVLKKGSVVAACLAWAPGC